MCKTSEFISCFKRALTVKNAQLEQKQKFDFLLQYWKRDTENYTIGVMWLTRPRTTSKNSFSKPSSEPSSFERQIRSYLLDKSKRQVLFDHNVYGNTFRFLFSIIEFEQSDDKSRGLLARKILSVFVDNGGRHELTKGHLLPETRNRLLSNNCDIKVLSSSDFFQYTKMELLAHLERFFSFNELNSPVQLKCLSPLEQRYSPKVQTLISLAHQVFNSPPTPSKLNSISQHVSAISFLDIKNELRLSGLQPGQVGCVCLAEEALFNISIFVLTAGSTIVLHDHPEMSVFSHLLMGSVRLTSFDYTQRPMARMVESTISTAPHFRLIFPTSGGNLHTYTSDTGCIFLDLMTPPYGEHGERECTYYQAMPFSNGLFEMIPIESDFEAKDISVL